VFHGFSSSGDFTSKCGQNYITKDGGKIWSWISYGFQRKVTFKWISKESPQGLQMVEKVNQFWLYSVPFCRILFGLWTEEFTQIVKIGFFCFSYPSLLLNSFPLPRYCYFCQAFFVCLIPLCLNNISFIDFLWWMLHVARMSKMDSSCKNINLETWR
jgi:hypothetical protein